MLSPDTRGSHYTEAELLIRGITNRDVTVLEIQATAAVALTHAILATAPDSLFDSPEEA